MKILVIYLFYPTAGSPEAKRPSKQKKEESKAKKIRETWTLDMKKW
jgi:hypothetical protein